MLLVLVLEFTVAAIWIMFVVSQILAPIFKHQPLFPLFRTKARREHRELQRRLQEAKELEERTHIEAEIVETERKAELRKLELKNRSMDFMNEDLRAIEESTNYPGFNRDRKD